MYYDYHDARRFLSIYITWFNIYLNLTICKAIKSHDAHVDVESRKIGKTIRVSVYSILKIYFENTKKTHFNKHKQDDSRQRKSQKNNTKCYMNKSFI